MYYIKSSEVLENCFTDLKNLVVTAKGKQKWWYRDARRALKLPPRDAVSENTRE